MITGQRVPAIVEESGPMSSPDEQEQKIEIPRGAFLLLALFLIVVIVLWANVYLRVIWRA